MRRVTSINMITMAIVTLAASIYTQHIHMQMVTHSLAEKGW